MAKNIQKITVLGSGSWATALVKIISEHPEIAVTWCVKNEEYQNHIATFHRNPKYLSSVEIHSTSVTPVTDIQQAISNADLTILAIPSAFLSETLKGIQLPKDKYYVSAVKGIDPKSKQVIARFLENEYQIPSQNIGLITGPCHAEEVALEKLSYLTISALETDLAQSIEKCIACRYINTTVNNDLYGAEYAAVLKNIYAIGSGIAHGLGYGDNFQAVYVGAALREMELFLDALHETHRDVKNAAYLGDLLVTCYSQFSRNRTFGNMLGKGYSVKSAQLEMNMIAEGYYATESVQNLCNELELQLSLVTAVYEVLYQSASARLIFNKLAANLS
ncbi:MAG: NAD(P)-binding domain-containing protein [Bacteroidia bacterium]|nr:NAD(P)-binding domain-containing protein [Bacteroidia bacterium]